MTSMLAVTPFLLQAFRMREGSFACSLNSVLCKPIAVGRCRRFLNAVIFAKN